MDASATSIPADDVGRTDRPAHASVVEEEDPAGRISLETIAGHSFRSNTFNVTGDVIIGSGDRRRVVPFVDLTDSVRAPPHAFVRPPRFAELVATLKRHRIVVLVGHGAGKSTASRNALRDVGAARILQLPGDVPVSDLVDAIEQICDKQPATGILIDAVDVDTLARLGGFELTRLRAALGDKGGLSLTTEARATAVAGLAAFECVPPDPEAVAEAMARGHQLDRATAQRAREALTLLPEPSPATVSATIEAAKDPARSPQEIASIVVWNPEHLRAWLADHPTAAEVASMAVAASLEGVPADEAEIQTGRLREQLEVDVAKSDDTKRFTARDDTWPTGVVDVQPRTFESHFGRVEVGVLVICPPHTRERIVTYLWGQLGSDFRGQYLTWLSELASSPSARLRSAVAITAGVLFMGDSLTTERELLRAWALSDTLVARRCAGAALGVPVALGGDSAPARMLANAWGTGDNRRLRHAAVIAYGGLLGVWDPTSAAAVHLWRIGEETPELRGEADWSLSGLVCAGDGASRARASAIELLVTQRGFRKERARVYSLLPLMIRQLAGSSPLSRDSLQALLSDRESAALESLANLLAWAFDSPVGFHSAQMVTIALLQAMSDGSIEPQDAHRIIRAVIRAATDHGRVDALASGLRRTLVHERHRDNALRDVAQALLDTFYV